MSSTDLNFNPGAALAIGYASGFMCSISQTKAKRALNSGGVIDSNGTLFQFFIPSFLAAVFSAVLQGVGQTSVGSYGNLKPSDRSATNQGGFQIAGWAIATGIGILGGIVLGIIYKIFNTHGDEGSHE